MYIWCNGYHYNRTGLNIFFMYAHTTAGIISSGGGGSYDPTETVTLVANGTYAMAAKLLAYIKVKPVGALAAINIGTTPGGTELVLAEAIGAGVSEVFSIGRKFDAAATLYITGITSSTELTFYKF